MALFYCKEKTNLTAYLSKYKTLCFVYELHNAIILRCVCVCVCVCIVSVLFWLFICLFSFLLPHDTWSSWSKPGPSCSNARSPIHCARLGVEQCSRDTADSVVPKWELFGLLFSEEHRSLYNLVFTRE